MSNRIRFIDSYKRPIAAAGFNGITMSISALNGFTMSGNAFDSTNVVSVGMRCKITSELIDLQG